MEDNNHNQLQKFLWIITLISTLCLTFLMSPFFTGHKRMTPVISSRPLPVNWQGNPLLVEEEDQLLYSLESELSPYYKPRFYNRQTLIQPTKESFANRIRLVERLGIGDFSWREAQGLRLLYQGDQAFSGWFQSDSYPLSYFKNGLYQPKLPVERLAFQYNEMTRPAYHAFYLERGETAVDYQRTKLHYGIVVKSSDQPIYSDLPGIDTARFISSSEPYLETPLDVVEEVTSSTGTWLHVYTGYEELGWIRKDPTYTNYVLTYYSEQELLDHIQDTIATYMQYVSGTVGASFVNVENLTQVSINNQIFFPASTQKIYVLGKIYDLYRTGDLKPDSLVTLSDENRVPGAGILQGEASGNQYPVDYLVDLIPAYSDNTAANMLIEVAGEGAWITPFVHRFELMDTFVDGKYYHSSTNGRFQTSPGDAARYFALIARGELNGEPWDSQLKAKFMGNVGTFLTDVIPDYLITWNKTGLGITEQNDVATFETDYGTYTLAVYTENPYNYDAIPDELRALSRAVYDTYVNYRSLLWQSVVDPASFLQEKARQTEAELANQLAEDPELEEIEE